MVKQDLNQVLWAHSHTHPPRLSVSLFSPIHFLEKRQSNGWHFRLLRNCDEKKNNRGRLVESYKMIKGFEYMINRLLRPMDLTPY